MGLPDDVTLERWTHGSHRKRMLWVTVGLAYLLVPISHLVTTHSGWRLVLELLGMAAFVAAYLGTVATRPFWPGAPTRVTYLLIGVTAALGVGLPLAYDNGSAIGMPIYLAVLGALAFPLRYAGWAIAAGALLTLGVALRLGAGPAAAVYLAALALSMAFLMLAFRNARTLAARLLAARADVARLAATEERLRIARDLHDLLGHTLSLIVLKAELARRDPSVAQREITDLESVARQALTEVREAVTGYRSLTLAEALDDARSALAAASISCVVRVSGTPLPPQVDQLFGWAVREGVTNVVRHAGATRCVVTVGSAGADAVLSIQDHGGTPPSSHPAFGSGLSGLTERVAAIGGTLTAKPSPSGFRLEIHVPVAAVLPAAAEQ